MEQHSAIGSATLSDGRKSTAKSTGSRTSIKVKLPSADVNKNLARNSPVHVRALSPSRLPSPYGPRGQADGYQVAAHDPSAGLRNYSPHSSGTVPPLGTPTRQLLSTKEVQQIVAARMIERAWMSYRDRQMFKLLKHAICAAEHSLSHEILRKVSPQESELLKDKCMQAKIRFRFSGHEFPPMIYFKIYSCNTNGVGVKYVSGKKMIKPASEAARDACDRMGHRLFYDQLIQDMMLHDEHKVTGEVDITTLKDYMQYLSLLDETPSYMGGRDNAWRKLTLEVLPRHTVFYDLVGFLYSRKMTPDLRAELPVLLTQPTTEDIQLRHIDILTRIRTPQAPCTTPKAPVPRHTGRRTHQARQRASRMKRAYESQKQGRESASPYINHIDDPMMTSEFRGYEGGEEEEEEEEWEEEADKLYEWTQQLSLDEIVATPRLGTALTNPSRMTSFVL